MVSPGTLILSQRVLFLPLSGFLRGFLLTQLDLQLDHLHSLAHEVHAHQVAAVQEGNVTDYWGDYYYYQFELRHLIALRVSCNAYLGLCLQDYLLCITLGSCCTLLTRLLQIRLHLLLLLFHILINRNFHESPGFKICLGVQHWVVELQVLVAPLMVKIKFQELSGAIDAGSVPGIPTSIHGFLRIWRHKLRWGCSQRHYCHKCDQLNGFTLLIHFFELIL